MSSSRPRSRRVLPSSLRGKLIAQLIALLAVVCLVVGLVTEVALRSFLISQLDDRLAAASERGARPPPAGTPSYPAGPRPPDSLRVPGQGIGTLGVFVDQAGVIHSGVLGATAPTPDNPFPTKDVPAPELRTLLALPANGQRYSVDLGELGEYRVVSVRHADGTLLVTGLPLSDVTATLWQLGFIFGGVALGGLLLAGGIGAVTIRRTMRPLDRLAHTAAQVSELPLDRGEVALSVRVPEADTDPRTEVGKVGAAFNRMLGHVAAALTARQASESRVRQFVADASHELRTPLAAIRGYAELTRRSSDAVPPEIAFAMSRVESESARMTTLVEDLLLLARLDSGRNRVHEPVDLTRLVMDAVADAHAAGPDHRWVLDVPPEPLTVVGDADQLQQVVLNLLTNARTHTPPGTHVTTALSTQDRSVMLTVTDNGPGIPQNVLPEVFERFARADTSRSRAAGSTGLGLAIVAAVVAAHKGEVSVASRPGRTEFRVRFPAAGEADSFTRVNN
ncbi:two-component system OmpR family sensor kinase [Amycolatopsis bartoniae]|uniref:histidine kinase n=1 Tax=Amycolatopsis bartoniae TaxID=941986 RepID=A0A8H9IWK3_9PSEU|nr:HAMP domain-containing sensor histidine kinase [Amycolatopsis bartoniae]MBB2935249.1 two-component system OmpR family sensor kinase [Amycolatopsis bartoniae]TVT04045.1 HAMP domain-containing protein [Amycolatopsis bartoniae]GHF75388.1 two-component sensor histidine kinase [Amycolatopsis bartoniae]